MSEEIKRNKGVVLTPDSILVQLFVQSCISEKQKMIERMQEGKRKAKERRMVLAK